MKSIQIIPAQHLTAQVSIPGSKSYTNRALLMASLTPNRVIIKNPLISDDTITMFTCLGELGITCTQRENEIEVDGSIQAITDKTHQLHAKLSGTAIRFLLALSCVVPGTKILTGDEGLNKRPIAGLIDALRQLGAHIEYLEQEGHPPLRITSSTLQPDTIAIKGSISSQYFSSIMMIAPLIGELTLKVIGHQISKPYIDMTIDTMDQFGIKVINNSYEEYVIPEGQKYAIHEYSVEGDFSSAGYFAAIATLTQSTIKIQNLNPYSVQADRKFFDILGEMGNKIIYESDAITVQGKRIIPIEVDMEDCPDQVQTLAVLAAFVPGTTTIHGIESLRVKETNRVIAIEQELKKMEISTSSTEHTLVIHGGNPKAATIETYGDHRVAMSFAVAGTKLPGMIINEHEVVSKTFPEFWKKLEEIGIKTEIT